MNYKLLLQIIGLNILIYGSLINHYIGVKGIPLIIFIIVGAIILPLILFIKTITTYKKGKITNLIKIFLLSYLITLPLIHVFYIELFLGSHGISGIKLDLVIDIGKIALPISIIGGLIGVLFNIFYRSLFKKH